MNVPTSSLISIFYLLGLAFRVSTSHIPTFHHWLLTFRLRGPTFSLHTMPSYVRLHIPTSTYLSFWRFTSSACASSSSRTYLHISFHVPFYLYTFAFYFLIIIWPHISPSRLAFLRILSLLVTTFWVVTITTPHLQLFTSSPSHFMPAHSSRLFTTFLPVQRHSADCSIITFEWKVICSAWLWTPSIRSQRTVAIIFIVDMRDVALYAVI